MTAVRQENRGSHQRLRVLRQNRGMAQPHHGATMRDRVPPHRRGVAATALLIVAGVLALSLPHSPQAASGANPVPLVSGTTIGGISPEYSWNNGRVALTFPAAQPSFSVTSLSDPSLTAAQTLTGLAELNLTDTILSFASFSSPAVSWVVTSQMGTQGTNVVLTGAVPVVASGGEWESGDDSARGNITIGVANVTITFSLNASSSSNPWGVSYSLNVSQWPWLHGADSVGVEVRSNAAAAPDYWMSSGSNRLTELSRTTNQAVAAFAWGDTAKARYSGGNSQDASIGAYQNLSSNGSTYLVRLEFGTVTGGYTSISYDPWLSIIPPGSAGRLAAWLVTPTSLAIVAGGSAATIALAIVARARRSPPETGL